MTTVVVHGGAIDDGPAINAALSGAVTVSLPDPVYNIATKVVLNSAGQRLIGDGRGAVKLLCSTPNAAISVANGVTEFQISDFDMVRVGIPIAGQNGIDTSYGIADEGLISRIEVSGFWQGFCLGPTSFSLAEHLIATDCYDDGIVITNRFFSGGLQWDTNRCLSQQNNGLGFLIETVTGDTTLGDHEWVKTFANLKGGFAAQALAGTRINSVRLLKPFCGQDGGHEILLSTGPGTTHQIVAPYVESAGRSPCGVGLSHAATNQGCGIYADPTVNMLAVTGGVIAGCSWSGIETWALRSVVNGASLQSNGFIALPGEKCGFFLGGPTVVTGCLANGHFVNLYAQVDSHIITDNDLRNWSYAAIAGSGPLVVSKQDNNLT